MTDNVVELNPQAEKAAVLTSGLPMRTLMADDMFTVLSFVEKLDLTDKIIELMEQQDEAKDVLAKRAGYEIIMAKSPGSKEAKEAATELEKISNTISKQSFDVVGQVLKLLLGNLKTIKTELNTFLADILEGDHTAETVGKLPLGQYMKVLRDFFEVTKAELKELLILSK